MRKDSTMNFNKTIVLFCVLTLPLIGCTNNEQLSAFEKPIIKYKVKKVKDTVSNIPLWFTSPPKDESKVYSVGTAHSPDIQLSVDMAIMNAKYTLADRINGKLTGMMKTLVTKLGSDDINSQIISEVQKVGKNVISSVDVAGYQPKEIKVFSSGTQYQAFVLLEYSETTAKQVIMNRIIKNKIVHSKINSTNAWKEMEKEVNSQNVN